MDLFAFELLLNRIAESLETIAEYYSRIVTKEKEQEEDAKRQAELANALLQETTNV